ncbi:glucosaminidase domain-containing protein [Enterococcus sp.]|uniref:glucosaminidase domain-containing protein n=1 Tax=Enterococcus sp. TaxID=35783 RepID=UPI002FC885C0
MKKIVPLLTGAFVIASSTTTFLSTPVNAKNLDEKENEIKETNESDKQEIPLLDSHDKEEPDEQEEIEVEKNVESEELAEKDSDSSTEIAETTDATDEQTASTEKSKEDATPTDSKEDTTPTSENVEAEKEIVTVDAANSNPTSSSVGKNQSDKINTSSSQKKTTTAPKKKNKTAKTKVHKSTPFAPGKSQSSKRTTTNRDTTSSVTMGENSYTFSPNFTTQRFIKTIGEDARNLGQKHGLYASVMIAQAILESASGNSSLASPPNYNLFGIKGSYKGTSVNFATQEDDGGGNHFTIRANFRKYPSYKQSLEDYVKLIRGGLPYNHNFYSGVWKSNTKSYQDATRFLMGRYATDTSYAAKLNGLIRTYNLTAYDIPAVKVENLTNPILDKKTENSKNNERDIEKNITVATEKSVQPNRKVNKKQATVAHTVKAGESLVSICRLYQVPLHQIVSQNGLNSYLLAVGQVLEVGKTIRLKEEEKLSYSVKYFERDLEHFSKPAGNELFLRLNTPFFKNYSVKAYRQRPAGFYSVQRGDTLAKIAKRFKISVQSLRRWNNLEGYLIYEGQQLRLTPWLDDFLPQVFTTI